MNINGPPEMVDQSPHDCHEPDEDWIGGARTHERCTLCNDDTYIGTPPTDCPRCYHPKMDTQP